MRWSLDDALSCRCQRMAPSRHCRQSGRVARAPQQAAEARIAADAVHAEALPAVGKLLSITRLSQLKVRSQRGIKTDMLGGAGRHKVHTAQEGPGGLRPTLCQLRKVHE